MARAKLFLNNEQKQDIARLFYNYPVRRIYELLESGGHKDALIPDKYAVYLPYLESQAYASLVIAMDTYDCAVERSKKKRPLYFQKFVDEISKKHLDATVLRMNAAIARVEGKGSRQPLKADHELYEELRMIADGQDLLDNVLVEIQNS